MPTFDMSKSKTGVDLVGQVFFLGRNYPYAPEATSTSTSFATSSYLYAGLGPSIVTTYTGTGFNAVPYGLPTTGSINSVSMTGITYNSNGTTSISNLLNITGLPNYGVGLLDASATSKFNNTFLDSELDYILFNGNDTVIGSAFNDVLYAGAGVNTINGGAGTDTVNYSGSYNNNLIAGAPDGQNYTVQGVMVDLAAGVVSTSHLFSGSTMVTSRDTLTSIENVIGSNIGGYLGGSTVSVMGLGGDILSGNAGANTLWGLAWNDTGAPPRGLMRPTIRRRPASPQPYAMMVRHPDDGRQPARPSRSSSSSSHCSSAEASLFSAVLRSAAALLNVSMSRANRLGSASLACRAAILV
jgi:Ca2+-binding RTX toxin-like protein